MSAQSALTTELKPAMPNLSVESFQWGKDEYGSRVLQGVVVNNSDKTLGYAQIEFNLYDKEGAQVGSTLDNVNNLEPFGRWKFKAHVMEKTATKAKVKEVFGL